MKSKAPLILVTLLAVTLATLRLLPTAAAVTSGPPGGHSSRDEGKIVFQSRRSGNSQIWIMNADGSEVTRLTNNSADEMMPVISPDGGTIAFVSDRDGAGRIYLMAIDGTNQRPLTGGSEPEEEPAWMPDGEEVVFRKTLDDGGVAIFAASAGQGELRQITDGSLRPKEPHVSLDGSRMLFNSLERGIPELWIMELEGGRQSRIPGTPEWGMAPVWSPDGGRIAFGLLDPTTFTAQVHVMNADGRDDAVLTPPGESSEYPCWSPDGSRIAFQTSRDGNFEIYVMYADGTGGQRLTSDPAFDGRPSWGTISR